jgi:hypothetical protein
MAMARQALTQAARRAQRTTTAGRALAPGTRPLGLIARDICVNGPSPQLAAFPDACGNLGANAACAEALAEVSGIRPLLRCQHFEAFARSTAFAGADVQGVQPWDDLRPLVPLGGRGARGPRQSRGICEGVDEKAFAFPALRDTLTAAFARGQTSHPRPHTATESCRAPRRAPVSALAWQPGPHRRASAAATDARYIILLNRGSAVAQSLGYPPLWILTSGIRGTLGRSFQWTSVGCNTPRSAGAAG